MRLRRIGNSLGTTFSRDTLRNAGLTGDEDLDVLTGKGEIVLRRSGDRVVIELTKAEAEALAAPSTADVKVIQAAQDKVRKVLGAG